MTSCNKDENKVMETIYNLLDMQQLMIFDTYNNIGNLEYISERISNDNHFLLPFVNNLSFMLYGEITKSIHSLLKDEHSNFKLSYTLNYLRQNKKSIHLENKFNNKEIGLLTKKLEEIENLSHYQIIKNYRNNVFAHTTNSGNSILEEMYNSSKNYLDDYKIILNNFQKIINQINYWLYGKPRITHEIISSNFEDFMKIYERR